MRRIAIVGAGQAGFYLAFSLLEAGYAVTLFAERTAEAISQDKPRAMPMLFQDALELESKLGLDFDEQQFPNCNKVCNYLCDPEGNLALVVSHNLEERWQAIDQRLKFPKWMQEFEKRGGELIIREMQLSDLEDCTNKYDLVVVAAGRGSLSSLFERDEQKSVHEKPQRKLAACIVTNLKREQNDLLTHKVTLIPGVGEVLQMPFHHKDKGHSYVLAFEACFGGAMDQFGTVQSGQEMLELSKRLIEQFTPWDEECVRDIELADEQAWFYGALTPTVRKPVGRLSNGAIVMGIADAVVLNDPLAAQGANTATKIANIVAQRIIEHGDRKFDADWMQRVFDESWQYSQYAVALTNCMLTPSPHMQDIMGAVAQNPHVAKDFYGGFNNPPSIFPWFADAEETKNYLEQKNSLLAESAR